jgi:hypothetical protein
MLHKRNILLPTAGLTADLAQQKMAYRKVTAERVLVCPSWQNASRL